MDFEVLREEDDAERLPSVLRVTRELQDSVSKALKVYASAVPTRRGFPANDDVEYLGNALPNIAAAVDAAAKELTGLSGVNGVRLDTHARPKLAKQRALRSAAGKTITEIARMEKWTRGSSERPTRKEIDAVKASLKRWRKRRGDGDAG
jgi:hypothetical protein